MICLDMLFSKIDFNNKNHHQIAKSRGSIVWVGTSRNHLIFSHDSKIFIIS